MESYLRDNVEKYLKAVRLTKLKHAATPFLDERKEASCYTGMETGKPLDFEKMAAQRKAKAGKKGIEETRKEDGWEEKPDRWIYHHITPRQGYFHPKDSRGGPNPKEISQTDESIATRRRSRYTTTGQSRQ